jgi:sec-independent protein translocase protein TatA
MNNLLFLQNLNGWEWVIILVVILLLFGGKKIPELMKGIGKGIRGFKDGMKEIEEDIKSDDNK